MSQLKLTCSICFEEIEKSQLLFTPCIHVYHEDCLIPWIEEKKNTDSIPCPVCKYDISELITEAKQPDTPIYMHENNTVIPRVAIYTEIPSLSLSFTTIRMSFSSNPRIPSTSIIPYREVPNNTRRRKTRDEIVQEIKNEIQQERVQSIRRPSPSYASIHRQKNRTTRNINRST